MAGRPVVVLYGDCSKRKKSDLIPRRGGAHGLNGSQWAAPNIRQQVIPAESKKANVTIFHISPSAAAVLRANLARRRSGIIHSRPPRWRPRNESKNIDQPPTAFWGPNRRAGVIISCGLIQSCGKICDLFGLRTYLPALCRFLAAVRSHCEPTRTYYVLMKWRSPMKSIHDK